MEWAAHPGGDGPVLWPGRSTAAKRGGSQYWFRRGDYGLDDGFESSSVATLVSAFQRRDWAVELRIRTERENAGKDPCSPGFGVEGGDGRRLVLCPEADDALYCHYYYPIRERILGIFPVEREEFEVWLDSQSNAPRSFRCSLMADTKI